MKRVDFEDLIDAYFEAAQNAHAHDHLRTYVTHRLSVLESMFGTTIEARLSGHSDVGQIESIARRSLAQSVQVSNPFPFYIEGVPPPAEAMLRRRHWKAVKATEEAHRQSYRAIFRSSLEPLFPYAVAKTFSETMLFELGVPEIAPNPYDYW